MSGVVGSTSLRPNLYMIQKQTSYRYCITDLKTNLDLQMSF